MVAKPIFTPVTLPTALAAKLKNDNWSIAITGASGWMGQALLEALEPVFGTNFDSRVAAFGSKARMLNLRSGRAIPLKPTEALGALPQGNWLLAHCAYGTRDRVGTQGNDAFIDANSMLTESVLRSTAKFKPRAILFPSSGAVYDKSGAISENLEANPYGVLKHRDELYFAGLADTIGARFVTPRVFNMAGPYINKWSAYALSDLIVQRLDGKPLTIQSPGPVMRSYVHVGDILALALHCLLDDAATSSLTFDTRGGDVELAELAQQIEEILPGQTRSNLRVADVALPGSIYLGQPEPMRALCAQYELKLKDLRQQIRDTAEDIILRRTI